MAQAKKQTEPSPLVVEPHVGPCYSHGWKQLWKYILELLLITILSTLISIPTWGLSAADEMEGPGAFFLAIFSLAYLILLLNPVEYGVSFAFLKAARGDKLEVKDMFDVFQNYLNAVLANILVGLIIGIGIILLIIPGIVFACKLAFVPYLIVERKMEAIEAVKESWRMTTGHAAKVFLIGLLAIPIFIAGLLVCGIGVLASIMWVELAFASLYHAVSTPEAPPATKVATA